MYVTKLALQNFRNFKELSLSFEDGVSIFCGDNAQGKTNLLESVYMCATGRSQRAHTDRELINFDAPQAHARAVVKKGGSFDTIDLHLKNDGKKGVAVNGLPVRRLGDLFGILRVVIFSPEDLYMIKSGPSERREFIDIQLCQLSPVYYYELQKYYRILKQRNNLLKELRIKKELSDSIFVWDSQLVESGIRIMAFRRDFLKKINVFSSENHSKITGGLEKLEIVYRPYVSESDFMERLKKNIQKDIKQGSTASGIHKDDISFFINKADAKLYGSQGQQRTASLSAKLAQVQIIKEETGDFPVLLLDDVLSELDKSRQSYLIKNIAHLQTLLSCTGVEDYISMFKGGVNIFRVSNGNISLKI